MNNRLKFVSHHLRYIKTEEIMKQLPAVNSLKINKHIFSFVVPFVLDGKQVKS